MKPTELELKLYRAAKLICLVSSGHVAGETVKLAPKTLQQLSDAVFAFEDRYGDVCNLQRPQP